MLPDKPEYSGRNSGALLLEASLSLLPIMVRVVCTKRWCKVGIGLRVGKRSRWVVCVVKEKVVFG